MIEFYPWSGRPPRAPVVQADAEKNLGSNPGRHPGSVRGVEQTYRVDTNTLGITRLKPTAPLAPDFAPPSGRSSSAWYESSPRPPPADHIRVPQRIPCFTNNNR